MELSLAKPQMLRKPLMLKDYLLDDLSSCSSSGFRTYPRRQCCSTATVRFLLEIDLKNKPPKYIKKPPTKNHSKTSPSPFQRAINAVKSLPFAAVKSSSSSSKLKLTLLPRSLSRKLLKRSFWKRNDGKEIQRREPINQLMIFQKKSPPSDFTTTTAITGDCLSSTSESNTNSKSNSWSDNDFTGSDDTISGNYSEVKILNEIQHDVVLMEHKKVHYNNKVVSSKSVGVIVRGDDSIDATTSTTNSSISSSNNIKNWPSEEEKEEQFSPVSVLDCPFDDDDDEVSSPFQDGLAHMEGTKKRLMKKIMRFERLTQLEPVKLEKRIALSESDQESSESPQYRSTESVHEDCMDDQASDKAFKLLQLVKKATIPSISLEFKADHDRLLLDFFKEGMEMDSSSAKHDKELTRSVKLDNDQLLNVASGWIMGQPCELRLEWEVQRNREAYVRDMERGGTWRKMIDEEQEVALELEVEVFASLMNELLNDLI